MKKHNINTPWCVFSDSEVKLSLIEGVASCFCGDHPLLSEPKLELKNQKSGDVQRFVQLGIPRSGSTVVYQIMNEMYPKEVRKSHNFKSSCPILHDIDAVIATVRHPYDVAISILRMNDSDEEEMMKTIESSKVCICSLAGALIFSKNCSQWINVPSFNVLFMQYEDFYYDDIKRVRAVAKFLGKNVSTSEIERIAQKFSIDENKKRSIRGDEWVHKDHIGSENGIPGACRDTLSQDLKDKIYKKCTWIFQTFNYER